MSEEKPPESLERPIEVFYAFWLIIASLVLGIIAFPLRPEVVKPQLLVVTIIAFLLTLAFTVFLFVMILRGKNWARLLFLIFFLTGFPFSIMAIFTAFQKTPIPSLFNLIQLCLQMMAAVLLLQKPSRRWFQMIKLRKLVIYQMAEKSPFKVVPG
jgi:hypothetical protein